MYSEPGSYIADFCIVRKDAVYHLFHIHGDRGGGWLEAKDFGHAVSKDLQSWTPVGSVVPAGPPGSWEESRVFAPHVIEKDGIYHMLYTGLDNRFSQKIGLATSTDLFEWKKSSENPVLVPQTWSDLEGGGVVGVDCRDPMVFEDNVEGRYLIYYTATMRDGRACLGLAQSADLVHWDDLGPTYIEDDTTYNRLESPFLCEHNGKYYLFYSGKGGPRTMGADPESFAHFEINYLISESPTGSWTKPKNHVLLEEWCCASEHPAYDRTTYMLFLVYELIGGKWRGCKLSDPASIRWLPDGTVEINEHIPAEVSRRSVFDGTFAGWARCHFDADSSDIHTRFPDQSEMESCWVISDDGVDANCAGDSYFISPRFVTDIRCEAELLATNDSIGSLVLRSNQHGTAGYLVSLDYERRKIGFYRRFHGEPKQLIQERDADIAPGRAHKIKAVTKGQFFEIYLDDALTMVRADNTYAEGAWGLHANSPGVRFANITAEEPAR